MSGDALALAVKALIPTTNGATTWKVWDGDVSDSSPAMPWVVLRVSVPGGSHRSDAQTRQAGNVTVTVLTVAASQQGARMMLDTILPALDGARPVASGWSCGVLVPISDPRTDPTDFIPLTGGSSRHVWQGTAAFRLTASEH